MKEFNFTNRDTYLAFRAEWKQEYAEISNTIRTLKREHSAELAAGKCSTKHYAIARKRREANAMLLLLADAKQESARQWAAAREGVVA